MAYNVVSGDIITGVLYYVAGGKSVVYNTLTYTTGQYFRGVNNITTFTFSGTGSGEINEVTELRGAAFELVGVSGDQPVFPDVTELKGFAIEYELNDAEKVVNEVTKITGFALELIDYPFYSFEITETRL